MFVLNDNNGEEYTILMQKVTRKICLFGATGNTGSHFLHLALQAGWEVKAFLRTPSKVEDAEGLTKFKGDLSNATDIWSAIEGTDVVVCLAGVPRGTKPGSNMDGMMRVAIEHIVDAMESHAIRRLIFQVGGFTRLEGEPQIGCFASCFIRDFILGYCLGETVSLKENQLIAEFLESRKATIDWTLTRPGILVNKESLGTVVGSDQGSGETCTFVDLAAWEVQLIEDTSAIHKGPFPVYGRKNLAANPTASA